MSVGVTDVEGRVRIGEAAAVGAGCTWIMSGRRRCPDRSRSASTSQVSLVLPVETSTNVTVGVPTVVLSQLIVAVKLLGVSDRFVSVNVAMTTGPVATPVTAFKVCTGVVSARLQDVEGRVASVRLLPSVLVTWTVAV